MIPSLLAPTALNEDMTNKQGSETQYAPENFGALVQEALEIHESRTGLPVSIKRLSEVTGIDYSHIHAAIKGRKGVPAKVEAATAKRVIEALDQLGVQIDVSVMMKSVGAVPEGYRLVPDQRPATPPGWEEFPEEFAELWRQIKGESPEEQRRLTNRLLGVLQGIKLATAPVEHPKKTSE